MSEKIFATLVEFSTNMWYEVGNTRGSWYEKEGEKYRYKQMYRQAASEKMRLDRDLWDRYMVELLEAGNNTLVIDLGDGVVYDSHPELALPDSWSKAEFVAELEKLRKMGFKLIPKLNFSTTHDTWMKQYSMMVSSDIYYKVCSDLIDEVCEMFHPEYFHIGMDEEDYEMQKDYDYITIRNGDLWWHDLKFLAGEVEKHGARAIMWSDYARHRCDEFIEKCPRSIVQAVWYYHDRFYGELEEMYECRVRPFERLATAGFDIFAAGSTCVTPENLPMLVEYCKKTIPDEQLIGFCQTVWESVTYQYEAKLVEGNEAVKQAIKVYYEN